MYNRKIFRIYIVLPKNVPYLSIYNYVNLYLVVFFLIFFLCISIIEEESGWWLLCVKKKKQLKKIKKIDILIKCSIK